MEVTYEGPEGALITGDGKSVMFQQIAEYNPPQWPDPAHPQRRTSTSWSRTWTRAGQSRGVGRDAAEGRRQAVADVADPAGHPFDLTL